MSTQGINPTDVLAVPATQGATPPAAPNVQPSAAAQTGSQNAIIPPTPVGQPNPTPGAAASPLAATPLAVPTVTRSSTTQCKPVNPAQSQQVTQITPATAAVQAVTPPQISYLTQPSPATQDATLPAYLTPA